MISTGEAFLHNSSRFANNAKKLMKAGFVPPDTEILEIKEYLYLHTSMPFLKLSSETLRFK